MWEELFKLGDEIKKEHGTASLQYEIIRELDRRLQRVYDERNEITEELLEAPCETSSEKLVAKIRGLKVLKDGDDIRYEINGTNHFDTAAEVLEFMIQDYNKRYTRLLKYYEDAMTEAVECSAHALYNRACADFHEAIEKAEPKIRQKFDNELAGESE